MPGATDPKRERYVAAMVLAGAGDALGYKRGKWEFNQSGPEIHKEVEEMGGLSSVNNKLHDFTVSDETVMHLATATALVTHVQGAGSESLYNNFADEYIKCVKDMAGRSPGETVLSSCHQLLSKRQRKPLEKIHTVPFSNSGGSCLAATRAMCIGLRYPGSADLDQLIGASIESGRTTHNHPTGYLGALTSALFTTYAIQSKPVKSWGAALVDSILPMAKSYIETSGADVEKNLQNWQFFEKHWTDYIALRQIRDGLAEPVFPDAYGVEERDAYYKSIAYEDWGGTSGHDSVIIAYDALLGCNDNWDELVSRACFHGGDSDATGTIAACWFGALHGFKGVYETNYKEMEYREEMEQLAHRLYKLSHPAAE
ncbi:ADP-ribosylhydrolase ARH1-like [Watersipora subatra]|uniref:ADP-ribosylhydrolase ARH1-like n=1 Tax=Watersipora subatra TaxID=2589382 RepID=UPI00355B7E76